MNQENKILTGFKIPIDPFKQEHREIKARQRDRKTKGKPGKVSNEMLYEMLSDILENQARIENMLNKISK